MRWDQGRGEVDALLARGHLQRVVASRDHADLLVRQARAHLAAAAAVAEFDPPGAYALAYDAARKALTAILENQGVRPTRSGGHLAAFHAVRAQLVPPMADVLSPFDRIRRTRNETEYPAGDRPELTADDVLEDQAICQAIVQLADRVLDQMSPF